MRKNPTTAESILWNSLRGKKMGIRFYRQYVIGDYIADFVCLEKNLIIEVDGEYHSRFDAMEHDELRTDILTEKGFTILRFKNDEVLNNTEMIIEKIYNHLDNT